ncbi:hypothetical protein SAMN05660485_03689 [Blastococcus fimeti]|nr:hypothetical protein SAMN05660485_03689 [Blastococcus fimeti]
MTAELLASPRTRRKAVLDTCAVFQKSDWQASRADVEAWLGDDGVAVLPARVVAEMTLVAARKTAQRTNDAAAASSRARLAIDRPGDLLGGLRNSRAVLGPADIGRLCRDNADLQLVQRVYKAKKKRWVHVPGDADFEIAHTVRVLTGGEHEAVLVTRDGDLRDAAERLGIALLGRSVPPCAPAGAGDPGAPLPATGSGAVFLLGLRAATQLLKGKLPALGTAGDTVVVLSSTLVLAAQHAAMDVRGARDGDPDQAELAEIQHRLDRVLASGRSTEGQLPVHVLATPWPVYRLVAQRAPDPLYGTKDEDGPAGRETWDMHTLLVLAAAQVLGDDGHRVHLVDSGYDREACFLVEAARSWRKAGALQGVAGAHEHQIGTSAVLEAVLPSLDGKLDIGALMRRYGQH